ncbi:undecaprenyl-diphosphatase 1 [Bacterioplanes sanyensis]|uniref:undecaprenyl-diphosphate phosphatase n=1 Tax=Bacterioplanes sanyensis TaxID=1249553 RepID=UPI001676D627|nr:undecaprenyl-diphosphate phosphatase [Bacterioplanes sanyensis]GGY45059.1 undecaprenyl-diphosphatase 1 [Bacterioplanes sanyensis]
MDMVQALILALIQGLTEFLPISSSAHLILPSQLFGWPDQGLAFDVAVHLGTLLAVMFYFRRDIWHISRRFVATGWHQPDDDARLGWWIIVATLPAGFAGLFLNDWIAMHLRSVEVITATTLIFGGVLWLAHASAHEQRTLLQMTLAAALVIGLAQALALIPGTSRSGITMTAALLLGFNRMDAARFSFLLSIPLILAAGLLKGAELLAADHAPDWLMLAVATLVAAVSAWLCIYYFLAWLQRIGLMPFVIYRLLLGLVLAGLLMAGVV